MGLSYDSYLAHYGVKGMKWGVRKKRSSQGKSGYKERYNKLRNSYDSMTVTSKNGKEMTITQIKVLPVVDKISALRGKDSHKTKNFKLSSDGKSVGDASFTHVNKDEINLVWLGVDKPHRGKGYGQAAFDTAIEYGRQNGAKRLTLEVPGNAPDARHIYEQRGFKVVKEPTAKEISEDFVWGGLTHMALDLNDDKISHSEEIEIDHDIEKALIQTFSWVENITENSMEHGNLTYGYYLAHYGVKGMKWGIRKRRKSGGEEHYSSDHKSAKAAENKAKKYGAELLSNKELNAIQQRANLKRNTRTFDKTHDKFSKDKSTSNTINKVGRKKGTRALSNEELETAIRRMELEKRYDSLKNEDSAIYKGRSFAKEMAMNVAQELATSALKEAAKSSFQAATGGPDQSGRRRYTARQLAIGR